MKFRILRRRLRGFSLIEIIFAIAMLAIGIVGILSLFTTGIARATWAQNATGASMEVQSLVTRILTETTNDAKNPERIILKQIHAAGDPPAESKVEWIQFDENLKLSGTEKPVRVDEKRDYWWKCRCRGVRSDRDVDGKVTDWYPPMNPDDPFDKGWVDKSKSPNFVNGLYEIAIAVYKSSDGNDLQNKKPIAVYTTFINAGF